MRRYAVCVNLTCLHCELLSKQITSLSDLAILFYKISVPGDKIYLKNTYFRKLNLPDERKLK